MRQAALFGFLPLVSFLLPRRFHLGQLRRQLTQVGFQIADFCAPAIGQQLLLCQLQLQLDDLGAKLFYLLVGAGVGGAKLLGFCL